MTHLRGTGDIDWVSVLGPLATVDCGRHLAEWVDSAASDADAAPRSVRLRPELPLEWVPFPTEAVPWYRFGRIAKSAELRPGAFLHHPAGDYYVQDAGSMLALALCELQPGQMVCDLCAAPGGKSTGLLELLSGSGLLVANEVIASRTPVLNMAIQRTGFANCIVTQHEPEFLADLYGTVFDCVLVDAPCTGQSMVARRKQSSAAYTTHQIDHSAARQRRILEAAASMVKPGGRLVYSTCTFSYAENEQVIHAFLSTRPGWQLLRSAALSPWESPVDAGCYRVWPHCDPSAGAFAVALCNREGTPASPSVTGKRGRGKPGSLPKGWERSPSLPPEIAWVAAADVQLLFRGQQLHLFPASASARWLQHSMGGLRVARFQKGRWEPLYGAARWGHRLPKAAQGLAIVELDTAQACDYVEGAEISFAHRGNGWQTIAWQGRHLACGKLSSGVIKNHFPKPLRQNARV